MVSRMNPMEEELCGASPDTPTLDSTIHSDVVEFLLSFNNQIRVQTPNKGYTSVYDKHLSLYNSLIRHKSFFLHSKT